MMLEKKTGEEIWDEIESVDGRDSLCNKVWVSQESLKEHGVQIECQADGSNNPQKLEDGIFIPYRWLDNFNKKLNEEEKQ